jgi:unsaturated rhamnogalacturonyl hydrolase
LANAKRAFDGIDKNVVRNNSEEIGAVINAANEMEMLPFTSIGKNKNVFLDNYFNCEWRKGAGGQNTRWHYTWDEKDNNGFYFLGNMFEQYGAKIFTLTDAPTSSNLQNASVYIIVDPDTEKETAHPNYMNEESASYIADWVKAGGVLVLLGNNHGNAELQQFNILAKKFGVLFNDDNQMMVQGNHYEQGEHIIPPEHLIFKTAKKIYTKEVSSLTVNPPAKAVLSKDGLDYAAVVDYGSGHVFILGDPWIYNEYVDGRNLPLEYENYKGAKDLIQYLLKNAVAKTTL